MIFYGIRENSIPLAELGSRQCAHCGDWHDFRAHVKYIFMHIFWAFGMVLKREYIIACDHCDRGTAVRRDAIPALLGDDPIPLLHRWGFVPMLLVTLGLLAFAAVSGARDTS